MSDDEEETGIIHKEPPSVAYQGPPESFQPAHFPLHGFATEYPQEIHPAPYQQAVHPAQQPVQQEAAWEADKPPPYQLPHKNTDDSQYRCLCNTHVHKAVIAICVISLINSALQIIFEIIISIEFKTLEIYETIWPTLSSTIIHILLLVGNRKKKKWMYYPYLILHLLNVAGFLALSVILILTTIGFITFANELAAEDPATYTHDAIVGVEVLCGTLAVICLIMVAVQLYFFWIIIRAYKYLKDVLLNPHSDIPRV